MRQITITCEVDENVARQLEKAGLLTDPEATLQDWLNQQAALAHIRHELQNALTPALGYTVLLRREIVGDLNDQQRDFLDRVFNSLGLIKELLNPEKEVQA